MGNYMAHWMCTCIKWPPFLCSHFCCFLWVDGWYRFDFSHSHKRKHNGMSNHTWQVLEKCFLVPSRHIAYLASEQISDNARKIVSEIACVPQQHIHHRRLANYYLVPLLCLYWCSCCLLYIVVLLVLHYCHHCYCCCCYYCPVLCSRGLYGGL